MKRRWKIALGLCVGLCLGLSVSCSTGDSDDEGDDEIALSISPMSPQIGTEPRLTVTQGGKPVSGYYLLYTRTSEYDGEAIVYGSGNVDGAYADCYVPIHGAYTLEAKIGAVKKSLSFTVAKPSTAAYAAMCELPGRWGLQFSDPNHKTGGVSDPVSFVDAIDIDELSETSPGLDDWTVGVWYAEALVGLAAYDDVDGKIVLAIAWDSNSYYRFTFTTKPDVDPNGRVANTPAMAEYVEKALGLGFIFDTAAANVVTLNKLQRSSLYYERSIAPSPTKRDVNLKITPLKSLIR